VVEVLRDLRRQALRLEDAQDGGAVHRLDLFKPAAKTSSSTHVDVKSHVARVQTATAICLVQAAWRDCNGK